MEKSMVNRGCDVFRGWSPLVKLAKVYHRVLQTKIYGFQTNAKIDEVLLLKIKLKDVTASKCEEILLVRVYFKELDNL